MFTTEHIMYILLIIILLLSYLYIKKQDNNKNSQIYITDLITENGRLEEKKLTRFGTWIVSTWGFVYLIIEHNLTEWYFIGYMGAWVANALLGKWMVNHPDDNYGRDKTKRNHQSPDNREE